MMAFWSRLTAREKWLMRAGGALALLCLIVLVIVPPLRAWRADTDHALATSLSLHEWTLLESPNPGAANASAALAPDELRQQLIDAAARRGLAVARLQTLENERLLFSFEQAPSEALFGWLAEAEDRLGATPATVTLETDPSGALRARIEFEGVP